MTYSKGFPAADGRPVSASRRAVSDQVRVPVIDGLVLLLLPSIINLSAVPDLPISRLDISLIFLALLLKNVFVYSAVSPAWLARVNAASVHVFSLKHTALMALLLLIGLFVIADMRAIFYGTSTLFGFFGFFLWSASILLYLLSVSMLNPSRTVRTALLMCLVVGLGLYVLTNIAGYLAGLRGFMQLTEVGQNKLLSLMGINAARVGFPFASGLNNFGTMAGLAVVTGFAVACFGSGGWMRSVGLLTTVIGLAGALLGDSRAAFVISVLVCVLIPLVGTSKRITKFLVAVPLLILVLPPALIGTAAVLGDTGAGQLFARDDIFAQRLGLLSGRDAVWGSAYAVLLDAQPQHIIGYGSFGQFSSGATQTYAWVFSQISGRISQSLHNANLQVIFDTGYLGLTIWLVFWLAIWRAIAKGLAEGGAGLEFRVPLAVAGFISVAGVLEVCGTPSFPDSFAVLMFVVAWLLPPVPEATLAKWRRGPRGVQCMGTVSTYR